MKHFFFLGVVVLACAVFLFDGKASAQTTATLGEHVVGTTGCKTSANTVDFDTLAQCTSTTTTSGTMQKAPLFFGPVGTPPYASFGCDANKAGMIQYIAGYGFLGCNGSYWIQVRPANVAVGTVMPDGTISAGAGIYTTPCDIGMTGTKGSCSGTRTNSTWRGFITTCAGLTSYGHNDWYFPPMEELYVLYLNYASIGGFDVSATPYGSSTIMTLTYNIWTLLFASGGFPAVWPDAASTAMYGRCVRR